MSTFIYVTDCEGPVVKNDNAYELSERFLENGGKLFSVLSAFDDYLGLFCNIEDYAYGSTLKYIVPFFLEAGLKDDDLRSFSKESIVLTKDVIETLKALKSLSKIYMISTSYEHFIDEVSSLLGLERERVFCTRLSLDSYELSNYERSFFSETKKKILSMPELRWDPDGNLLGESKETFEFLKRLFFEEIPKFRIQKFLQNIKPVGGKEKARFLREIVERENVPYENVIYVGDSITDTDAFDLLRAKGGLTVSFNGNRYAVHKAEYVLVSETSKPLLEIVTEYIKGGKEALEGIDGKDEFLFTRKKDENIVRLSEHMRKTVRGVKIGSLG